MSDPVPSDVAQNPVRTAARWGDLRRRGVSAVLMVAVGGAAIWAGGAAYLALILILTAAMTWELARLTAPDKPIMAIVLAALAAACLYATAEWRFGFFFLALPAICFAVAPRQDRELAAIYAFVIMLASYEFLGLRSDQGGIALIWLVCVVISSDLAGYFVGRSLGGPLFWASISPKKTWSGTVAGWVAAALVGVVFVLAHRAQVGLIWLSALIALAGQMGDILESWIKRRAGAKDSSGLIPGHGGVMDRFDAMLGAGLLVLLVKLVAALPFGVAG